MLDISKPEKSHEMNYEMKNRVVQQPAGQPGGTVPGGHPGANGQFNAADGPSPTVLGGMVTSAAPLCCLASRPA
ncbi:hypothetical protein T484DRAFT_1859002 [Baffinella frigidus]|nr:hypothetical protein T484DRAFT_1859002 [Cryptophyta sp. CCMP2293]